jgi:hypothetical protein
MADPRDPMMEVEAPWAVAGAGADDFVAARETNFYYS